MKTLVNKAFQLLHNQCQRLGKTILVLFIEEKGLSYRPGAYARPIVESSASAVFFAIGEEGVENTAR